MSQFADQPGQPSFDLLESAPVIDELFKLFQFIDTESLGHLSVEALATFQQRVAERVDARVSKQDLNAIFAALITNSVKEERQQLQAPSSSPFHQLAPSDQASARREGTYVTWEAFQDTMVQWLQEQGPDWVQTVADQEGFLTSHEVRCLYQLVMTFFVQGDVDKRGDMLRQCHMDVYNIEKDMMHITPEGNACVFEKDEYEAMMRDSKTVADHFSHIQQQLAMQVMGPWKDALEKLRQMLQVMDCFEGTQSHRLVEHQEHLRRIMDLVLGSTCFEAIFFVLKLQENPVDSTTAQMKIEALKSLVYLTIGAKYLCSAQGLQSNYQRQRVSQSTMQSISQASLSRDNELGSRLVGKLVETDLVCAVRDCIASNYVGVVDLAYVTLGSYIKNNVDITELFTDMENFQRIYSRVDAQLAPSTLNLMTWSLYIFTSRCFTPGSETPQLMVSVAATVNRLTEILGVASNFEQQVQQYLMQLVFLALGNVIHMHQPTELTKQVFDFVYELIQAGAADTSEQTYQTALRVIYLTLKYTKIHTQSLTESNKIVTVLQTILNEQSSHHEKLKLLALKTLTELAASGYHMVLLDVSLIGLLMRYLQNGSNSFQSVFGIERAACLHQTALEVFHALISSTQYNLQQIIQTGLIRTICTNFDAFRIKKDPQFELLFDGETQQIQAIPARKKDLGNVHRHLQGVKFVSLNYLIQSFHTLDILLNNLGSPEQVLSAFPMESLQHFKPVVDILVAMVEYRHASCHVSLITQSIERIKTFFEQLKRKLYNSAGGARLSQTRSATATLESIRESQEFKFATDMALFLDTTLQDQSSVLDKYLSETGDMLMVICYPSDESGQFLAEKHFQVSSSVRYDELYSLIDQKFETRAAQIEYMAAPQEQVTIDSDFVLKRAIQKAVVDSYQRRDREVILRLLVFLDKPNQPVQCTECGRFLPDYAIFAAHPSGRGLICEACRSQQARYRF